MLCGSQIDHQYHHVTFAEVFIDLKLSPDDIFQDSLYLYLFENRSESFEIFVIMPKQLITIQLYKSMAK